MNFHKKKRTNPVLNIIPLIDVLCILLLFFIGTSVFRRNEPVVQIKLPETSHAEPSKNQPPAVIWVTPDEKVFLDNQPIPLDALATILKKKMELNPAWQVALKADKKASFGLIIKVMDAAQFAGIKNLQTYTEEVKPSAIP